MDPGRDRLRDLSARLLRLHKLLLDRQRRAYELRHGAVPSAELFRLLLQDESFAWLRALSSMIAGIDETVDTDGALPAGEVERVFRAAYQLLKSDAGGDFQRRYHDALQESPEVVMAHADISKLLPKAS